MGSDYPSSGGGAIPPPVPLPPLALNSPVSIRKTKNQIQERLDDIESSLRSALALPGREEFLKDPDGVNFPPSVSDTEASLPSPSSVPILTERSMSPSVASGVSAVSSVTNRRNLEWDSGADLGYLEGVSGINQKNAAESLSTLEKMAIGNYSSYLRTEPEGKNIKDRSQPPSRRIYNNPPPMSNLNDEEMRQMRLHKFADSLLKQRENQQRRRRSRSRSSEKHKNREKSRDRSLSKSNSLRGSPVKSASLTDLSPKPDFKIGRNNSYSSLKHSDISCSSTGTVVPVYDPSTRSKFDSRQLNQIDTDPKSLPASMISSLMSVKSTESKNKSRSSLNSSRKSFDTVIDKQTGAAGYNYSGADEAEDTEEEVRSSSNYFPPAERRMAWTTSEDERNKSTLDSNYQIDRAKSFEYFPGTSFNENPENSSSYEYLPGHLVNQDRPSTVVSNHKSDSVVDGANSSTKNKLKNYIELLSVPSNTSKESRKKQKLADKLMSLLEEESSSKDDVSDVSSINSSATVSVLKAVQHKRSENAKKLKKEMKKLEKLERALIGKALGSSLEIFERIVRTSQPASKEERIS